MTENKITLGQLVAVLQESGINLKDICLDESQVQKIQDTLTSEQQQQIAGNLKAKLSGMTDEELSQVSGGYDWKKLGKNILKGTVTAIGAVSTGIVAGGSLLFLASKFTDTVNMTLSFGDYKFVDGNNKWGKQAKKDHKANTLVRMGNAIVDNVKGLLE
ncbi:MAG: hypothetical protein J6K87_01355 [Clostridia bacterium]|nr:hypothetical protein [Clostridia bacterium]